MKRTALAVVLLLTLALTACGGGTSAKSHSAKPTQPSTFDVAGTLTLSDSGGSITSPAFGKCPLPTFDSPPCYLSPGEPCTTLDGFSDIAAGTQVKVMDNSGKVIALGELGAGKLTKRQQLVGTTTCGFPIDVHDVPDSGNIYGIEVGDRGVTQFTKADAASVSLTLDGDS